MTVLVLASTSPARRALLTAAGVAPLTLSPGVDEPATIAAVEAETGPLAPEAFVQVLARAKAEAVALPENGHGEARRALSAIPDALVVGGDSAFVLDGTIFGKPYEPHVATERWRAQRGRTGVLHSGHHVVRLRHGEPVAAAGRPARASVTFADVTDAEIDAYVATGEPLAVAGAFTVDSLGGPFVARVDGDPSCVVGLSLATLRELVLGLGVAWTDLWRRG